MMRVAALENEGSFNHPLSRLIFSFLGKRVIGHVFAPGGEIFLVKHCKPQCKAKLVFGKHCQL